MSDDDFFDDGAIHVNDCPDTRLAMVSKDLIEDTSLSTNARFLMIWLDTFGGGNVSNVRVGMSEEAFESATKELRERGLILEVDE